MLQVPRTLQQTTPAIAGLDTLRLCKKFTCNTVAYLKLGVQQSMITQL